MGRRDLLSMAWRDALFAHWPVDPAVVAEKLPDRVEVATHGGDAWLGVVAFVMADIRPRGAPLGLTFGELNLRTYVRDGAGERGVYFFNLDATDPVGVYVARWLFRLPYFRAAMELDRRPVGGSLPGNEVTFVSHRIHPGVPAAHVDATYRPTGEVFEADPGSLARFLTENYFFLTEGRGRLFRGDVDHDPWPLQEAEAEFRTNTLFEADGFDRPEGEPLCHYSTGIDVTATRLYRVG
ncbi:MAG: YqjF family protein [Haloferacaceae archaeon]